MRTLTLDYVVGALNTLLTHLCFKGLRCKWRRVELVVSDGWLGLIIELGLAFNLPVPGAAHVAIGDIYRNPWCATKSISQHIHWTPWLWTFSKPPLPSSVGRFQAFSRIIKKRQRVVVSHGYICSPVPPRPLYIWWHSMIRQLGLRIFDCSSRLIRNGLFDATFTHKITCVQPKRRNNVKDDCYKLAVKFLRWHVL